MDNVVESKKKLIIKIRVNRVWEIEHQYVRSSPWLHASENPRIGEILPFKDLPFTSPPSWMDCYSRELNLARISSATRISTDSKSLHRVREFLLIHLSSSFISKHALINQLAIAAKSNPSFIRVQNLWNGELLIINAWI